MKILYAIQGTGNGYLSRAVDIIPELRKYGEVDLLVSGAQAEIALPYTVTYKSKGLSFYFGKRGGIDFYKTFKHNDAGIVNEIDQFPVEMYDLIINDFEPISAWAAKKKQVKCIGLSHQSSLLSSKSPRPKVKDPFGEWILKNYAPVKRYVGFHFDRYDKNIYTPVIRSAVRNGVVTNKGHYTVYLPAYDDKKLASLLMRFRSVRWHIFSKHVKRPFQIEGISVRPIHGDDFVESMLSSAGVLTGAGFETPAEVLYLHKKLLVVPMQNQYEQHCNATALKQMGVPVLKKIKKKKLDKIAEWLEMGSPRNISYPDTTAQAVKKAVSFIGE